MLHLKYVSRFPPQPDHPSNINSPDFLDNLDHPGPPLDTLATLSTTTQVWVEQLPVGIDGLA